MEKYKQLDMTSHRAVILWELFTPQDTVSVSEEIPGGYNWEPAIGI